MAGCQAGSLSVLLMSPEGGVTTKNIEEDHTKVFCFSIFHVYLLYDVRLY
jgi:hypothetical protein